MTTHSPFFRAVTIPHVSMTRRASYCLNAISSSFSGLLLELARNAHRPTPDLLRLPAIETGNRLNIIRRRNAVLVSHSCLAAARRAGLSSAIRLPHRRRRHRPRHPTHRRPILHRFGANRHMSLKRCSLIDYQFARRQIPFKPRRRFQLDLVGGRQIPMHFPFNNDRSRFDIRLQPRLFRHMQSARRRDLPFQLPVQLQSLFHRLSSPLNDASAPRIVG